MLSAVLLLAAALLLPPRPQLQQRALAPPPPPPLPLATTATSRRSALLTAGALVAGMALPANAAFGPGGAAVTSAPPLKRLTVDEWLGLSPEKVAQRKGVVSAERARTLSQELEAITESAGSAALDALIESLERLREVEPGPAIDERQKRAKARQLAVQLQQREELMSRLDQQPGWVPYLAAFTASVGSTLVMHPVDTFKTLQMTQGSEGGEAAAEGGGAPVHSVPSLAEIAQLYRGLLPNVVKEGPSSALYLGVYELCKSSLLSPSSPLQSQLIPVYLLSGAAGEFVGSVIRAPSEATKARLQSGMASDLGDAFRQVVLEPRGRETTVLAWAASLFRDVPMGAVQIALFESLKTLIVQSPAIDVDVSSLPAEAALGAFGGLVGAVLTTPSDVVATRVSLQDADGVRLGPIAMSRKVYREEGAAAFFSGWGARGLYWAPAIGIFLGAYCSLRQLAIGLGVVGA